MPWIQGIMQCTRRVSKATPRKDTTVATCVDPQRGVALQSTRVLVANHEPKGRTVLKATSHNKLPYRRPVAVKRLGPNGWPDSQWHPKGLGRGGPVPFPIQSPELDKLRGLDTNIESASSWRHCVGPWYFEYCYVDEQPFDFDFDGSHSYSRRYYL